MFWFKKDSIQENPTTVQPAPVLLKVSDYLTPERILFFFDLHNKIQLIERLVALLPLPDHSVAQQAVLAREYQGTTIIGPAISVPHARLPGLPRLEAALGIYPPGLEAPSGQSERTKLFLLFISPQESLRVHLAFLASLSALFQAEGLVDRLAQMRSPESVIEEIRRQESAA